MGKVYEWARRDRPGSSDEGDRGYAFRARRIHRATAWDWVKWWREHIGDSEFRLATWELLAANRGCGEQVAELDRESILGGDIRTPLSAGLPDQRGVQE